MAGRRQYDNQTSIVAMPKVETINQQVITNELVTLAAGQETRVDIFPDDKHMYNMEWISSVINAPNTKGAASGTHRLSVMKGINTILMLEVAYDSKIQIGFAEYDEVIMPVAKIIAKKPATVKTFLDCIEKMTISADSGLTVKYLNSTNAVLTDLPAYVRLQLRKTEIA